MFNPVLLNLSDTIIDYFNFVDKKDVTRFFVFDLENLNDLEFDSEFAVCNSSIETLETSFLDAYQYIHEIYLQTPAAYIGIFRYNLLGNPEFLWIFNHMKYHFEYTKQNTNSYQVSRLQLDSSKTIEQVDRTTLSTRVWNDLWKE